MELLRAAAVQMDITLGDGEGNLRRVLDRLEQAASNGAKLIVFPESALCGYCFGSREEALPFSLDSEDEAIDQFAFRCLDLGVTGVLGFLECGGPSEQAAGQSRHCHNSAVVCAPLQEVGADVHIYRKTHLPVLGVDRFVTPGKALDVFDTTFGRLGVLICYDIRFPEAARSLALEGADVIALPTNWPEGAESSPNFLTRARAWENRVFIIAANRVGVERGRRFIGRSQIVSPAGKILCETGPDEETILYADLDLNEARQKRIVIEPGEWELDVIGGRRPDLYGRLIES
jgi:5-aminopentanamidase